VFVLTLSPCHEKARKPKLYILDEFIAVEDRMILGMQDFEFTHIHALAHI